MQRWDAQKRILRRASVGLRRNPTLENRTVGRSGWHLLHRRIENVAGDFHQRRLQRIVERSGTTAPRSSVQSVSVARPRKPSLPIRALLGNVRRHDVCHRRGTRVSQAPLFRTPPDDGPTAHGINRPKDKCGCLCHATVRALRKIWGFAHRSATKRLHETWGQRGLHFGRRKPHDNNRLSILSQNSTKSGR